MDPRIETVLGEWRFRSCEPGYAGLHALADAGFSGAVVAEDAHGFMINGRLVGITGGTIESFWSSEFSALEADDPALALLCAMLIADGEVETEYYTGETPISTVNDTLSSGGFTGFIELSENVFSGDYFILYYGGTSRSVAILGTEDRIVTGEEAFERADDEVGIYQVRSASISVIDIPEADVDQSHQPEGVATSTGEVEDEPASDPTPATNETDASAEESAAEPAESIETPAVEARPETAIEAPPDEPVGEPPDLASLAAATMGETPESARDYVSRPATTATTEPDEWITLPDLDPDRTTLIEPAAPAPEESSHTRVEESPPTDVEDEPAESPDDVNEQVLEELAEVEAENERLRARIAALEEQLEEALDDDDADTSLTPAAALDGTNLFVRYDTKASHTLVHAADGSVDPEAVRENLRLEWHTTFDDTEASIHGEPYAAFLRESIEYRFTEWLLEELLFELQDTGAQKGFSKLIAALPEVDRIEFSGTVPVHTRENGERSTETFAFDLVFRNGMGDPLLVAAVHDDRLPANGEAVGQLLADAHQVATERSTLGAALFVTRSYFEPEALETVAEATGSSFFGRGSKESYVNVSRKRGFHLCLVEARNHTFHLNVPES